MTRDSDDPQDPQDRDDRQANPRRRMVERQATEGKPTEGKPTEGRPAADTPALPTTGKRGPDQYVESVPSNMPSQMRTQAQGEASRRTPDPEPQPPAAEPAPARAVQHTQSLRDLLARVDDGWIHFRAAAGAFPSERLDERLSDGGWTRKQMLAHIAAWHDLAHDRLGKLITTGKSTPLAESDEAINARVARQAMGRSGGEVLKEMEMTFNRLRRQLARLTDEQLELDDGWASFVIAANTYEHYDEHRADVQLSVHAEPRGGRR